MSDLDSRPPTTTAVDDRPPRRGRATRWAIRILVGLAVVALLAVLGAGYYYSSQLLAYPDFSTDEFPVEVTAVDGDTVTHTTAYRWPEDGADQISGAEHLGGYAQLGRHASTSDCCVTRPFTTIAGEPLEVGDRIRLESYAFPRGLDELDGRPIEVVRTGGPLGEYEGRFAAGEGDTWVVFVHGRGGDLHEGYRLLDALDDVALPFLSTSFRNDGWGPGSPDGYGHFGLTEWEDLDAWVEYALDQGARDVVLAGSSMGGSVVSVFLRRSEFADRVRAVILDSPMLDIDAVLDVGGRAAGLQPPFLGAVLWSGRLWSSLRAGYDFDELRHVDRAHDTYGQRPVLLFHGAADETTPVGPSRRLAEVLGEQVTYVEVEDAGHIRPWNVARERYGRALTTFLKEHVLP